MTQEPRPGLIETMYADGAGIRFLSRHLARLSASAAALGIVFLPDQVESGLRQAVHGLETAGRLRLQLEADGSFALSLQPAPAPPAARPGIVLASQRLDSRDPLLRHKTTRRALYDAARADLPADGAVLDAVLRNERGQICEGAISNLFALCDGTLLTPPLSCGLLPGIMRGHVMEAYGAREAVLHPADLQRAQRLFLTNAVRGMIEVRLVA